MTNKKYFIAAFIAALLMLQAAAQRKIMLRPHLGFQRNRQKSTDSLQKGFRHTYIDAGATAEWYRKPWQAFTAGLRLLTGGRSDIGFDDTYLQVTAGLLRHTRRLNFNKKSQLAFGASLALNIHTHKVENRTYTVVLNNYPVAGSDYLYETTVKHMTRFSASLPLLLQWQTFKKGRPFAAVGLIYNHPITRNYTVDYKYTRLSGSGGSYREPSLVRGGSGGVNISFPLAPGIRKGKQ
jgi:hypothetical protein